MWYLLSIIIAIPLICLLLRFVRIKSVFIVSIILYVLGAVAYAYYWLPNIDIYMDLYNKSQIFGIAILRALPFIMISLIFICYKPLSRKSIISLLTVFIFLNIAEILFLNSCTENTSNFSYVITTLPLAIFIFSLISNMNIDINKKVCSYMRKSSTIIYCVHPMVYFFVNMIKFSSQWINFGLSLLVCLVFSFLLIQVSDLKYGKVLKYLY